MPSQFLKRLKKSKSQEKPPEVDVQKSVEHALEKDEQNRMLFGIDTEKLGPALGGIVDVPIIVEKEVVFVQPTVEASVDLPNISYDIFFSEEERRHKVATFRYDPKTGVVKIESIKNIGRQIGLQYENYKTALKTLIRKV